MGLEISKLSRFATGKQDVTFLYETVPLWRPGFKLLCKLFLDIRPLLYQQDQVFTQSLTIINAPEMETN